MSFRRFFIVREVIRRDPDSLYVSVRDKNLTSLLDACLHITAQKRMVYVLPCTFSKSYYELILIYNFEQKYYTTCSGGAKLFVHSIYQGIPGCTHILIYIENQEWHRVPDRKIKVESDLLWHYPNQGVKRGLDAKAWRPRLISFDLERNVKYKRTDALSLWYQQ